MDKGGRLDSHDNVWIFDRPYAWRPRKSLNLDKTAINNLKIITVVHVVQLFKAT